jgi:RNA polymerase primary sigma factor
MFDITDTISLKIPASPRKVAVKRHSSKRRKSGRNDNNALLKKLNRNDKSDALDKLLENNMGLVYKIASTYKRLPLPFEDLVSEGSIGLLKAAKKFDPEYGASFSTYATFWIKQQMKRAAENTGSIIRLPVQSGEKIRKFESARSEFTACQGREPAHSELAENLNWTEEETRKISLLAVNTVSMHEPQYNDSKTELAESLSDNSLPCPGEILAKTERIELIRKVVMQLDKRESKITSLYFGLDEKAPLSHEAIGKKIGISRERVRQIQRESASKLRHQFRQIGLA